MNLTHTILFAAIIGSASACGHKDKPATDPDRVTVPAAVGARQSIVSNRCNRESRCGNVGDGKKYSSDSDCADRISADWKDDLNARECPNGVNQQQLDECLALIKGEACGNPVDSLERVAECTVGQICLN